MNDNAPKAPLRFIDHHRQRYSEKVPIAEAGEFIIGSCREEGGLDEDGEFKITLIELTVGRRWALHPHLEAFGDGNGALRRAIDAGLLDALRPVGRREEFARRLLAIGMVDGSDEPLPGRGRGVRAKVAASREIVVYIPAGATRPPGGIARGSAIVGLPDPGSEEVRIYFEGEIFEQSGMITLADRAVHACGRLRERYPTVATRMVPRSSLVVVGTFHEASGRIMLTGEQSAAAVAAWLGVPILDPVELRHSSPSGMNPAELAALVPDIQVAVTPSLATSLIERGGLRREDDRWVAADGRRTSAIAEALLWALVLIAESD